MSSPASGPAVSVVIITRNRRDALGVVLDRLAELPVDEVLVVDNGSEDDTAGYVRARNGAVRLLEPGENIGIAGRNLAAREARGEFLLMLDDDSYPLPGAIEVLVDALRANPSLAAAGALVRDVDGDGRVVKLDELGTFDWWLRAGREGDPPPEGFPAFFFPEGAAMIRRNAYLDVGGFFEPYFVASTELDLAARLFQAGWDVRYFPTAVVDHMKAEAGRGHETGLYYRIRNHLWYIWLRYPTPVAVWRTLGYLTFDLIESTYRGVPKAWARAVRDAWRLRARVHGHRSPLARSVRRRAELNRGRMHVRLLAGQMRRRLPV